MRRSQKRGSRRIFRRRLRGRRRARAGQLRQPDYGNPNPSYGSPDDDIRQTVARLAYISGDVSFARGDDPDDWQPADPNVPMTLGDRVWTAGGRLELQIHGGNVVRLANATDLAALNLTEDTQQFSLSAGVASFQIRRLGDDDVFEVDTPNAAITFERTGDYRVDVRENGDTRLQVRRGRAIVASGGGQVPLGAGDAILIEGQEPPRYDMIAVSAPDGWDRWVADRDARYASVRSYQYVSADIAGVEDLDRHGNWRQVPNYGWCWTPASVVGGLAALPCRPLDLAGPVGMDLGLDGALGLGAVPLRALGHLAVQLVLGPRGAPRRGRRLQPGSGGLRRRRPGLLGVRGRRDRLRRVVPARARAIRSFPGGAGRPST